MKLSVLLYGLLLVIDVFLFIELFTHEMFWLFTARISIFLQSEMNPYPSEVKMRSPSRLPDANGITANRFLIQWTSQK